MIQFRLAPTKISNDITMIFKAKNLKHLYFLLRNSNFSWFERWNSSNLDILIYCFGKTIIHLETVKDADAILFCTVTNIWKDHSHKRSNMIPIKQKAFDPFEVFRSVSVCIGSRHTKPLFCTRDRNLHQH